VVVRVHGRERDHRSRSSLPSLLYLFAEGSLRELTGPGRVLGNHLVLDLGHGTNAVLAHLRGGSLRVAKGQRVAAASRSPSAGTPATSTEPHLHFQLQDHPSVLFAAGLPFRLARFEVDGMLQTGVPANGQPFTAAAPRRELEDRRPL
jgi:murein DD-endopeptidase MepM/ murein hydrolase activator NlpD